MLESLPWFGLGVAALMLLVIAVLVLLMPRMPMRYRVDRRVVSCPADGRPAEVDFVVLRSSGPDVAVDVLRCSRRPGEIPVECGRECRSAAITPYGGPVPATG